MIGVLCSGEGTNLQALIDAGLPVVAVASNRGGVNALARAEAAGIPTAVFDESDHPSREERDAALAAWLREQGAELAVLAGYMHLLRPRFFEVFGRRIVNTHSAPLPGFPGDTTDTLRARVQAVEHRLLPDVVRELIAS